MFSINLIFVDQKTIWDLNKKYRAVDKPTTVLSFYYGFEEFPKKRAGKNNQEIVIGEVFICPQEAKKQKLAIKDLIVHGINNLLSQIQTEKNIRIRFNRSSGNASKNCQK